MKTKMLIAERSLKADNYGALIVGCLLMILAFSRGFYEIYFPKTVAYLIQSVAIFFWFFWAYRRNWIIVDKGESGCVRWLWVFSLIPAGMSALLTLTGSFNLAGLFYFSIYFVIIIMLLIPLFFKLGMHGASVKFCALVSMLVLILFAILQQFGFFAELPGYSWAYGGLIRPSSITGSMLHYPIICAVLALVLLDYGFTSRNKLYVFLSAIGMLAVLFSFSRSGILILIVAFFWLMCRSWNARVFALLGATLTLAIIGFGLFNYINPHLASNYVDRVYSILDFEDAGNDGRFSTWSTALEIINSGHVLVSDSTGNYTNATANFNMSNESFVGESTFFTLCLNFGIIVGVLFYVGLFVLVFNSRFSTVGRGMLLGIIAQSFVYQSFEVLPYVFIVSVALCVPQFSSCPKKVGFASQLL